MLLWDIRDLAHSYTETDAKDHKAAVLTLNVLYHTIPRELCRCEVKDVHGLQSFVSTQSDKK